MILRLSVHLRRDEGVDLVLGYACRFSILILPERFYDSMILRLSVHLRFKNQLSSSTTIISTELIKLINAPIADMNGASGNADCIRVDGVEYNVSNLLSMKNILDKDRSTVPNYPRVVEPSPWQPEKRDRTGREQSRTTFPRKELLPISRSNSFRRRNLYKSDSSRSLKGSCLTIKPPKGDRRKYLTLKQRFDSSLRAVQKPPPHHASSSSSNSSSVLPPPPPPPPMENDDDNFEQDWTSPKDNCERRKQLTADPFQDSPYMRNSLNDCPSSMEFSSSSSSSTSSSVPLKRTPPLQMELFPGFHQPLLGAAHTLQAVSEGRIQPSCCMVCTARFSCVSEALYVVCPYCKTVSPNAKAPEYGHGVGLGFQVEDV
jgi:hypothetical protein